MFQLEICDLNGILSRTKINNNFWLIKVTNYLQKNPVWASSNQLVYTCQKSMIWKKTWSYKNTILLHSLQN